jgi:hypothetical protein
MTAAIIRFVPRSRGGDPDFPGIPEVANFGVVKCDCETCRYNATIELVREVIG